MHHMLTFGNMLLETTGMFCMLGGKLDAVP